MGDKTREALELIIEKAAKLLQLRFTEFVLNQSQLNIHATNVGPQPGLTITHTAPDTEAVEAFVLTYRFFIQDSESSSLRNLERALTDPDISADWKQDVTHVRDRLNQYLDSNSPITVNDKTPTYREIIDVFIYGDLAHANPQKRKTFKAWEQNTWAFPLLNHFFHSALIDVLQVIEYIAHLSKQELEADS